MKIAIIGSTGRAGSRILSEAQKRGHEVTGISRNETVGVRKDLFSLTTDDLQNYDVVVSAFATWDDQTLHLKAAQHLDQMMQPLKSRWIAVGGAGSLYVADGIRLKDTDSFPVDYKAVADGMTEGLVYLENNGQSNWSYFSPAAQFEPGVATGKYHIGEDRLITNEKGDSYISMEDYASALLDVIEKNLYNRKRFTAVQQ